MSGGNDVIEWNMIMRWQSEKVTFEKSEGRNGGIMDYWSIG